MMQTLLFFTRLALYATLVAVPYLISDAVVVAYDRTGKFTWFFLVPAMMCAAYFLRPPRFAWWAGPATAVGLLMFAMAVLAGFEFSVMLLYIGAGVGSYVLTRLVFGQRGLGLAALELFLFGLVYFKILSFTRSAEEIATANAGLIKFLLVLAVVSFLIHSLVLYLAAFPDRSRDRRRKEVAAFLVFGVVLAFATFLIPLDYVQNQIALNDDREQPEPRPLDNEGEGLEGQQGGEGEDTRNGLPLGEGEEKYPSERQGGGDQQQEDGPEQGTRPDENRGGQGSGAEQQRRQQEGQGQGGGRPNQQQGEGDENQEDQQRRQNRGGGTPRDGQAGENDQKVEGIPADQWDKREQSGEGGGTHQEAVMVIASPVDPVYAATEYWGDFDQEQGFARTPVEREALNELTTRHLVETWQDQVSSRDDKREPVDIYYLSTLSERATAYRPFKILPTVQDTRYHPFNLSYHAISRVSMSSPKDWKLVRDLNAVEKERMADDLYVEVAPAIEKQFRAHLRRARKADQSYFERIEAILRSFEKHQYERGFDEDTRAVKLAEFLSKTKTGDCTEFAHTAAVLARMDGIPSRVVIGFLASDDMQTPAHIRGMHELRKRIKPLQDFPMEQLYLVTNAHRHAWVQFFLPGFGWIDFESTAFAIPPEPDKNANNMDVLIPLIEEQPVPQTKPEFQFPVRLALQILAVAVVGVLVLLYILRLGREWYYYFASRGRSRRALKARFTYLLMQLARDGQPIKAPYQTGLEYAEERAALRPFAASYTTLLFKSNYAPGEEDELWKKLDEQHRGALKELRRPGVFSIARRLLSLRSLYY
ncbi:MAG: hypothetical protein NXI24_11955 [bacterium]|nr:hypothetical protein [bacterium]